MIFPEETRMAATKPKPEPDFIRRAFRVLNLQAILALVLVFLIPYFASYRIVEKLFGDVQFISNGYAQFIFDEYRADPGADQARQLALTHRSIIGYEGQDRTWYTDGQGIFTVEPNAGRPYYNGLWERFDLDENSRLIVTWPSEFFVPETHIRLFFSWVGAPFLFFIVIFFLLRRTLYPLRWMQTGIQELTAGNLDYAAPVTGRNKRNILAGKFNAMTAALRNLIRSKDQLIMDLSHELRSPITRIKVALALLPPDKNLVLVEKNVQDLEDIITTILETQRINLQSIGMKHERCLLADIISECIELRKDAEPGIVKEQIEELQLQGDKGLLKLLIHNLLDNALKYSHEQSDPVQVSLRRENNFAVLQIIDDGTGIPEESLPRVFEPFYKVAPERGFNKGYGLGLPLCLRIVELHGGNIDLHNNPERGLTVRVTLPLDKV
jgi:signal transduction histidine kinase